MLREGLATAGSAQSLGACTNNFMGGGLHTLRPALGWLFHLLL